MAVKQQRVEAQLELRRGLRLENAVRALGALAAENGEAADALGVAVIGLPYERLELLQARSPPCCGPLQTLKGWFRHAPSRKTPRDAVLIALTSLAYRRCCLSGAYTQDFGGVCRSLHVLQGC